MHENAAALEAMFLEYGEVCNRFDMKEAVKYFTEDAWIEAGGVRSQGPLGIWNVHASDEGARALVYFRDFRWEGSVLDCEFIYYTELDRVLGLPGVTQRSKLTFRDGLIESWLVIPPPPEELAQRRQVQGPVIAWAKEHRPELLERGRSGVSYAAGYAWTELAYAWREQQETAK